ncbi:MAG: helix-turn-helix domain-containing protein [Defluviitaleaceae bacterium]|nr:helix-turn-helix domain-containing protein [Defluviitaleaceae bacterium]
MTFGEKLKEQRNKKSLQQIELAKRIGVARRTLITTKTAKGTQKTARYITSWPKSLGWM